jgi:Flp pilus assembly protein TadG
MTAHRTKGSATIEFAFVGLAFISLLLLTMETGWQLLIDSALGAGARAASRFGTTGSTVAPGISPAPTDRNSSIEDIVIHNSGGLLLASRLQITEANYASFAALAAGGASTPGAGGASQIVQYHFSYTQPYLTPIAAAITGNQHFVHTAKVTVLNEPFPAN